MQAYGRSVFADRFAEKAADTSYSDYAKLRDVSPYDIRAAAEALWSYAMRNDIDLVATELTGNIVITALLARVQSWDDESELVSTEFEEYWDATDLHRFSPGLVKQMEEELARNFLNRKREDHIVVNSGYGIWTFEKKTIWYQAEES